jgi:hypothetical protein
MVVNEKKSSLSINEMELNLLKKEYQKAEAGNLNTFEFQGQTLVTEYAKYLIEYLTPKFKQPNR